MRTDTSRGTFEEIVDRSTPEVAAIAHHLRAVIAALAPDVVEVPRPAEHHADYSVGPNAARGLFAYLCPMPAYVRLGFYYGASLPDPEGLLEGTGKRLRHIKVYSLSDAERLEVQRLLAAAVSERKQTPGLE